VGETALAAYYAGLCPVPPRMDGSKAPVGEWRKYQKQRPGRGEIDNWYGPNTGLGLVCGKTSGNLECLEFDDPAVYETYKELAQASELGELVERVERGYLERSPSGGIHWLYQCAEISGNNKLARRPKTSEEMAHPYDKVKTLIEVRGEGGYIIIAPSYGRVHPSGKPYVLLQGGFNTIATLTPEERRTLFELARTFDLMPKAQVEEGPDRPVHIQKGRPGDDFNGRADWGQVLESHGWVKVYQHGEVGYWRRPGKDLGVSATTNWQDSGLLFVFSTSTVFESERGYSKFSAFALLEHGSDFKAAAEDLAKQGYGQPSPSRKAHHRPRPITTWEVRG
jgi:putative DNA primase/helicase